MAMNNKNSVLLEHKIGNPPPPPDISGTLYRQLVRARAGPSPTLPLIKVC